MSLAIENILDIMDYEGEEELELILSEFICQKNDEILKRIQHQIGGAVVYLDCEDKKKLITFYSDVAGYKPISERISERDKVKYLQFYKFIK